MRRSLALVFLVALATLSSATLALAQGGGGNTGTIQGKITDESGAVLPGVTVTATSPAMMGSQVGHFGRRRELSLPRCARRRIQDLLRARGFRHHRP